MKENMGTPARFIRHPYQGWPAMKHPQEGSQPFLPDFLFIEIETVITGRGLDRFHGQVICKHERSHGVKEVCVTIGKSFFIIYNPLYAQNHKGASARRTNLQHLWSLI